MIAVLAGCQFVQRRIFHREIGVAHRAAHMHDGVARHAAESSLRFRRVDLLANGPIEAAVEEHGVVVTTRAPLAGPGANHVLHVFDGLPVELIVERSEMVRGAFPLFVNVLVAAAAGLRVHEEVRRNNPAGIGLRRRRRKRRMRARAFQIHREWRAGRIFYRGFGMRPKLCRDRKQHEYARMAMPRWPRIRGEPGPERMKRHPMIASATSASAICSHNTTR